MKKFSEIITESDTLNENVKGGIRLRLYLDDLTDYLDGVKFKNMNVDKLEKIVKIIDSKKFKELKSSHY